MTGLEAFLVQDVPMLAAGVLASVACALVGCFLVLRKLSLMGDAISHAVLPGIVAGFLFAGTIQAMPIFIGAVIVGVLTAFLTEIIHRWGRLETGASMGVVFTILFAIGVLMLEHTGGRGLHLDADCVLHGAMEHVLWLSPPTSVNAVFTAEAWIGFPRQVTVLALVTAANILFVSALFKELGIAAFDPGLATSQGIPPGLMHYLLMTFVAITVIAAFEAVGSILVVAMLIVPGLIAHLYTNRLGAMLVLSSLIAAIGAAGGWGAAAALDLNAAAMIGVVLGLMLAVAGCFAPSGGWLRFTAVDRGREASAKARNGILE
jgi:manganese/zinc/iron transport system permease protein